MTSARFKNRWVTKTVTTMIYTHVLNRGSPRGQESRRTHSERRDSIYTDPHKTARAYHNR
jgi:hypothetical protein